MNAMGVLVTGASGYVGLHVVRELLAHGHAVTAVVRASERLGPLAHAPNLRVLVADLEREGVDAGAFEGHDALVHAALIWGEEDTELDMRDTAIAARLFDLAGRVGVQRCLYLSSAAVHRPFRADMCEDDPLFTTDLYGATKAAGELVLRAACAQYGMTGVVLRLGPCVGAPAFVGGAFRSDRRLAEIVGAAAKSLPIEVVEGQGRQWSDVCMVARATRALLTLHSPHATYLCMDREVIPYAWIARAAVDGLGSGSDVRVLPRGPSAADAWFRTERIEELLGTRADSRESLAAHVRALAEAERAR